MQELEEILQLLNSAHAKAIAFPQNLNQESAKVTAKLSILYNKPATEAVEDLAQDVARLNNTSSQVALKT
eukprot:1137272-Pelagomonas_calceolata.AAC.4